MKLTPTQDIFKHNYTSIYMPLCGIMTEEGIEL